MRAIIAFLVFLASTTLAHADFSACKSAYRSKDPNRQIYFYTVCIEKGSLRATDRAGAYNNRGIAYLEIGEADKALADFTRSIQLNSGWGNAYLNRAGIYLSRGQLDLAEADLDRAVRLPPSEERPQAFTTRGELRAFRGEIAAALDDYDESIARNRNFAPAYLDKAWLLAVCPDSKFRNGATAVELAKKAVKLSDDWRSHDTLAAAYAEAGQFEDAIKEEEVAIEAAKAAGQPTTGVTARLALYRSNEPYRSSTQSDIASEGYNSMPSTH